MKTDVVCRYIRSDSSFASGVYVVDFGGDPATPWPTADLDKISESVSNFWRGIWRHSEPCYKKIEDCFLNLMSVFELCELSTLTDDEIFIVLLKKVQGCAGADGWYAKCIANCHVVIPCFRQIP